jgi:hypothetical protein
MPHPLLVPVINWARNLRHPTLFKLMAALFLIDMVVPDLVPLIDELMLGLGTLWLASWKQRKEPKPPAQQQAGRVIEGESRR